MSTSRYDLHKDCRQLTSHADKPKKQTGAPKVARPSYANEDEAKLLVARAWHKEDY